MRAIALLLCLWPFPALAEGFADDARAFARDAEVRFIEGRMVAPDLPYPDALWAAMEDQINMDRTEISRRMVAGYDLALSIVEPISLKHDFSQAAWGEINAGPFVYLIAQTTVSRFDSEERRAECDTIIIADFDGVLFRFPLDGERNTTLLFSAYPMLAQTFETLALDPERDQDMLCGSGVG